MAVKPKHQKHEFPIPFVTRRSPVVLLIRILLAVFVLQAFYVILRLLAPSFDIEGSSIWLFLAIALLQVLAVVALILRWFFETYEIHKDDVIHRRGILFRNEEAYPYNNIQRMVCNQSPLGRIYHYGQVKMFVPTLGRDIVFEEVPHPHHFLQTVKHVMPYPDKQKFIVQG